MPCQDIWILAEQSEGRLLRISRELLTRGRALADERECRLWAVVIGDRLADAELQVLIDCGADAVVAVEAPQLAHFLVEPYARCMHWLLERYQPEVILAGATSTGRTLMPYVAMTAHCGLTADCTELAIDVATGDLLQTRPAIGGNIMATIHTPAHRPQMATVRPRSTHPAEPQPGRRGEIIRESVPADLLTSRVVRTGFIPNEENQGLQEADLIVCIGRGIKKAENLPLIRELVDALGGTLGATRDVVDRGWLSYPHQIGLSGQTVTPKLYIGIGVSGAIQHLAGMQTAETIVAINNDPDAQLLKVADLAIVGDLFEVVPALTAAIRRGEVLDA
jgi:electron transfer flavoprotein alpha subunit